MNHSMTDQEATEEHYERGSRAAWSAMLATCIRELESEPLSRERLIKEREASVAVLRRIFDLLDEPCDWDANCYLADVLTRLENALAADCE